MEILSYHEIHYLHLHIISHVIWIHMELCGSSLVEL